MKLTLRGHHLLCVHGFRGMGYSPDFVKKMSSIVEKIRDEEQDFPVQVVAALDEACSACPNKGETKCEASENSNERVVAMDRRAIEHLGLKEGHTYQKSFLIKLTAEKVAPDDLDHICGSCSWLSYGVCKEGIAMLKEKYL